MEHFISLNSVLHEYLKDQLIPNTAELLSIYGKVSTEIGTHLYNIITHFLLINYRLLTILIYD